MKFRFGVVVFFYLQAETSGYYRNILLALTGCHVELRKHDAHHTTP